MVIIMMATWRTWNGEVVECLSWDEQYRVFREVIGGDKFSHPALVQVMVRGKGIWESICSIRRRVEHYLLSNFCSLARVACSKAKTKAGWG